VPERICWIWRRIHAPGFLPAFSAKEEIGSRVTGMQALRGRDENTGFPSTRKSRKSRRPRFDAGAQIIMNFRVEERSAGLLKSPRAPPRAAHPDAHAPGAADDAVGRVRAGRHEKMSCKGLAQIRGRRAESVRRKVADRPRSGHRLRQELRAKLRIVAEAPQLAEVGYPLLVGTSRKGFLGATLARRASPAPPEETYLGHGRDGYGEPMSRQGPCAKCPQERVAELSPVAGASATIVFARSSCRSRCRIERSATFLRRFPRDAHGICAALHDTFMTSRGTSRCIAALSAHCIRMKRPRAARRLQQSGIVLPPEM